MPTAKPITTELVNEFLKPGVTLTKLSNLTHIDPRRMLKYSYEHQIFIPGSINPDPLPREQLFKDYITLTWAALCQKYNLSPKHMRSRLNDNGIDIVNKKVLNYCHIKSKDLAYLCKHLPVYLIAEKYNTYPECIKKQCADNNITCMLKYNTSKYNNSDIPCAKIRKAHDKGLSVRVIAEKYNLNEYIIRKCISDPADTVRTLHQNQCVSEATKVLDRNIKNCFARNPLSFEDFNKLKFNSNITIASPTNTSIKTVKTLTKAVPNETRSSAKKYLTKNQKDAIRILLEAKQEPKFIAETLNVNLNMLMNYLNSESSKKQRQEILTTLIDIVTPELVNFAKSHLKKNSLFDIAKWLNVRPAYVGIITRMNR